jgi:signal transduction histidine kinase
MSKGRKTSIGREPTADLRAQLDLRTRERDEALEQQAATEGVYVATKRATCAGNGFEPQVTAVTYNRGDEVEIRIRDNGMGIQADIKEKIFNPFFTTKPAGEGTGLGLSMSHDIVVKQHRGAIEVVTGPGSFTEFMITLPRVLP